MHDGQKCLSPEPEFAGQGFRAITCPDVSRNFAVETDDHALTCYIIPLCVIEEEGSELLSVRYYPKGQSLGDIKCAQTGVPVADLKGGVMVVECDG